MRKSLVEDTKIDLDSVARLPRVPQASFQGGMIEYLINPKFIKPKLAGMVARWIAADIAKGTRY